jgi:hypothetical protein
MEKLVKLKQGRPSKYKEEYDEMLIEHMKSGLSFESFAGVVEVNQDTLYEWAKVHESFSEAKSIAYSLNRLTWEKIALGASAGKIPNANMTGIIFNLKNRFPKEWRDRKEVVADVTASYTAMSDDDLKSRIRELLND